MQAAVKDQVSGVICFVSRAMLSTGGRRAAAAV